MLVFVVVLMESCNLNALAKSLINQASALPGDPVGKNFALPLRGGVSLSLHLGSKIPNAIWSKKESKIIIRSLKQVP